MRSTHYSAKKIKNIYIIKELQGSASNIDCLCPLTGMRAAVHEGNRLNAQVVNPGLDSLVWIVDRDVDTVGRAGSRIEHKSRRGEIAKELSTTTVRLFNNKRP